MESIAALRAVLREEDQDGKGTYSRSMRPDFAIETSLQTTDVLVSHENHQMLLILDAKYRVEAGLNDALSSIHMYRDALVSEENNNTIKRIVTGAYLITPGVYPTTDNWKN